MSKNDEIVVTKEEALAAYNGNATALAKDLNIVSSNVSIWLDGEPIPDRHALKLVFIKKRKFFKDKVPPVLMREENGEATHVAAAGSPKRSGEDGSVS